MLGRDTAILLDVLHLGPSLSDVVTKMDQIVPEYPDLFSDVGELKDFQLTIPLDDKVQSIVQPLRRTPYHLRKRLSKTLDQHKMWT